MTDRQIKLDMCFKKPFEPIFVPRDGRCFSVPDNFLTDEYRSRKDKIFSKFVEKSQQISVRGNVNESAINFTKGCPREKPFAMFNDAHRDIAGRLVKYFMDRPNFDEFIAAVVHAKDRVNTGLFQYALAVASAHRPDTKDLNQPTIVQLFPGQLVEPKVFKKLREEAALAPRLEDRKAVPLPPSSTASDHEEEHRLAYFREDIGVNSHHWHWHLVYPAGREPASIVCKDRRGELFYYMHNQMIARYNVERIANDLHFTVPLNNFRDVIPEGYFPKLINNGTDTAYPNRPSGSTLKNLSRTNQTLLIDDLERWRDRIYQAIDRKVAIAANGCEIPLTDESGIDLLGDMVEPSSKTPNRQLYGSLHNDGHDIISLIHDPDERHMEAYGVMGDVATAMRDPIFYRWHTFIDNIFARYKNSLAPYPDENLRFEGINILSLGVQHTTTKVRTPQNALITFWDESEVDLQAGLDFGPEGNAFVKFKHLQHSAFRYRLEVNNSREQRQGTVRLFLLPRFGERGTPLTFNEKRRLAIEMDKWTVTLNRGMNTITRLSTESSVSIPYERTFRSQRSPARGDPELTSFQFCGCGWPQHMLLPKGRTDGQQFDLFAIISDYQLDRVDRVVLSDAPCRDAASFCGDIEQRISNAPVDSTVECNDSVSFCGLRDRLYPDRRTMGYPLDRPYADTVETLEQYVSKATNMASQMVVINHMNQTITRSN